MRLILLLAVVTCLRAAALSQIPNAGFENWVSDPDSNLNPVEWQTTNSYPIVTVDRVSPGFRGSYAMRVRTVDAGIILPGVAVLETGIHFNQPPKRFSAYVKATIMPGDRAYLIVGLMKGDSIIAATDSCTFKIDSTLGQFVLKEFPLALQSSVVPDSVVVMVASGLGVGVVGTELIIDEISFSPGGTTTVTSSLHLPMTAVLEQNYPNPFNPSTTIRFQLPGSGPVRLQILDLLGRTVATLVDQALPAGTHTRTWEALGISSGTYYCRLSTPAGVDTRRVVVLR